MAKWDCSTWGCFTFGARKKLLLGFLLGRTKVRYCRLNRREGISTWRKNNGSKVPEITGWGTGQITSSFLPKTLHHTFQGCYRSFQRHDDAHSRAKENHYFKIQLWMVWYIMIVNIYPMYNKIHITLSHLTLTPSLKDGCYFWNHFMDKKSKA